LSYEIMRNDYDRYVLYRERDFFIIASSDKQESLTALRTDIMRRAERALRAKMSPLSPTHEPRQETEKNMDLQVRA
jgi:hypothetical protein